MLIKKNSASIKFTKILFVLAFLTSCNFKKETEQKVNLEIESLNQIEPKSNTQNIITTIDFSVKAEVEEAKDFENAIIPWINIEKPENQINRLIDADKVVITYPESNISN